MGSTTISLFCVFAAKNIMRKGNVAKVGDFDTAKILKEEMTEAGLHPRGTRGFAALEVLNQLVYLIEQLKNQINLCCPSLLSNLLYASVSCCLALIIM